MPNVNRLLENLQTLTKLDKELWEAFRNAEKEASLPKFRPFRLLKIRKEIRPHSSAVETIYPYGFLFAIFLAVLAIFLNSQRTLQAITLVVYAPTALALPWLREKFISAYSRYQLRGAQFPVKAFGIDNVSLNIFKIFEKIRSSGKQKISKGRIESLIKINKSSHEHSDTDYGYIETARKTLIHGMYATPIPAAIWISHNQNSIAAIVNQVLDAFMHSIAAALLLVGLSMLVLAPAAMLVYALAIGDVNWKIRRKRYLLILNILKESWEE